MVAALLVFCSAVLLLSTRETGAAPAALQHTRQSLPPRPGYVPVYIRKGDTPLEDINLDLAEAFRSMTTKKNKQSNIGVTSDTAQDKLNNLDHDGINKNEISYDKHALPGTRHKGTFDLADINKAAEQSAPSHIQKIPAKNKD